jgi:hypothetical protein
LYITSDKHDILRKSLRRTNHFFEVAIPLHDSACRCITPWLCGSTPPNANRVHHH